MAAKEKYQKKVHIGGTIDSDVADWLMKTRGEDKFSTYLNSVLRRAMELGIRGIPESATSLDKFKATIDRIRSRVVALQDRVESLEAVVSPEKLNKVKMERGVKRPRGRPRKSPELAFAVEREAVEAGEYSPRNDVDWYISHDKYKKIKAEPMMNAVEMVMKEFDRGSELTVGSLKGSYETSAIGVPYPTFKLFYFPMIRDRLVQKKIIQKVEHAGKKGVYRKR
jgi:hypothetical protein